MAQLAVDPDRPAALFDNAVDGGESQAGSLPLLLGRKERLEEVRHHFLGNAGARVADFELHVAPRLDFGVLLGVAGSQIDVGGFDQQRSAVRHGVPRIDGEVHEHLVQLPRVRQNDPKVGLSTDSSRISSPITRPSIFSTSTMISFRLTCWLNHLFPAEQQQLRAESGGAFAGGPDFGDALLRRVGGTQLLHQHIAVPVDDGKKVIEIVRHTPGQAADALQFLRLLELLPKLGLFLLRRSSLG